MSHVDEGALHAYLDGALDEYPAAEARRVREHVETCAECAGRLAEERRVRDEARGILDLAAPKVEVPTFEELRAYVRAGQSKRVASSRLYRMSWAASVVLALGTGWMIRGSRIDPMSSLEVGDEVGTTDAISPASADEAAAAPPTAPVEEAERNAPAEAPASARVGTEPARAETFERAAAEPTTVAVTGRVEVAQAPAPPAVAGPTPAADPAADQLAAAGGRAPARDDIPVGASAGAFGGAVADGDTQRQLADRRVQERIDSAARVSEARRRVAAGQADQTVTSTLDAAAPTAPMLQRAQQANEARREMDENESLVVPGLQVLAVTNVGDGIAFAGTRSLQQLENGDTLEVVHLPEGVDPSLLPPLAPSQSQVTRQHEDGWLVMRAAVPQTFLEQLLERLEAAR
jgi:hypothetical protein